MRPYRQDYEAPAPAGRESTAGDLTTGEVLTIAIGRSRRLIVLALLAGLATVLIGRQIQGPLHQATARVEITQDLSWIVTDFQEPVRDPARVLETERKAAATHEFFVAVDRRSDGEYGGIDVLERSVTVSGGTTDDVLEFTARADDPATAILVANEVAATFPVWRAEARRAEASRALAALRRQPAAEIDEVERRRLVSRLELIRDSAGGARLLERAVSAAKIRPTPVRDATLGLALGLLAALSVVGVREALRTRARSATEVENLLGTPVIAAVPRSPYRGRLAVFGAGRQGYDPMYRALAAIVEREVGLDRPPVIGLTAAQSDEATTTVAISLAIALSRADEPVTLVDVDVTPTRRGAAEVLGARRATEDRRRTWSVRVQQFSATVEEISREEAVERAKGLCIIEADSADPATRHLLGGQTADGPQREGWTVALLPPALSSGTAIDLSRHLDGLIVVVRQDTVARRNLRAVREQAVSWYAPLLGAVLADAMSSETFVPEAWPPPR